ncbi:MAG: hypothetical protein ACOC5F_03395 [Candidatus Aminicenantaceae bacterium]
MIPGIKDKVEKKLKEYGLDENSVEDVISEIDTDSNQGLLITN